MIWVAILAQIIPCAGSALIKDVTVFLEYYDAPEAALRAAASCKVNLHPCPHTCWTAPLCCLLLGRLLCCLLCVGNTIR